MRIYKTTEVTEYNNGVITKIEGKASQIVLDFYKQNATAIYTMLNTVAGCFELKKAEKGVKHYITFFY